jgi:hypothetical protein
MESSNTVTPTAGSEPDPDTDPYHIRIVIAHISRMIK